MLAKFWEAAGSKLADRWAAVAAPALVYWIGGLLAWAYSRGGLRRLAIITRWLDQQTTAGQLVAALAVLLSITGSALIVDRLTFPMLRLLEGYWPRYLGGLRRVLVTRVEQRAAADEAARQRLAPHVLESRANPAADQLAAFARLDQRLRRRPSEASRYLPTRVGNILRAAETWPTVKYGLDAVVVWPRLWLLLPDASRQELLAARGALDSAVGAAIWGLLFCVFTILTPLAIPAGLIAATTAIFFWVPSRAEVFGDLLESVYDLHRTALYQHLRWPLPTDPKQEHSQGEKLTRYLWRGTDEADPTFTPPA